ncbi:MAG: hypothetical protein V4498_01650 [candidate division FCPU426 bacterium]
MSLEEFLSACSEAGTALQEGRAEAPQILERCLSGLEEMKLDEDSMCRAGEALVRLRTLASARTSLFETRVKLSRTLVRALGGDDQPKPRVNKVF